MILHVWERAVAANLGAVVVATDSQEITDLIVKAGGNCELTSVQSINQAPIEFMKP